MDASKSLGRSEIPTGDVCVQRVAHQSDETPARRRTVEPGSCCFSDGGTVRLAHERQATLTPVFNSRLDTSGPRRSGAHRSIIDFDQGLACSILVMIRLPPACPAIPPSAVGSDVRMTARSESVVGASTSTTSAP